MILIRSNGNNHLEINDGCSLKFVIRIALWDILIHSIHPFIALKSTLKRQNGTPSWPWNTALPKVLRDSYRRSYGDFFNKEKKRKKNVKKNHFFFL